MAQQVEYTVKLYTVKRWATGSYAGTAVRTVKVLGEATILGGIAAIDTAVSRYEGDVLADVHPPEISPNPAEMGWPLQ